MITFDHLCFRKPITKVFYTGQVQTYNCYLRFLSPAFSAGTRLREPVYGAVYMNLVNRASPDHAIVWELTVVLKLAFGSGPVVRD